LKTISFIIFCSCLCLVTVLYARKIPFGVADENIHPFIYAGEERLTFEVFWSGGIKIGDLHLEVHKNLDLADHYTIDVRVKDSGIFHFFYPVNDTFKTIVDSNNYLPVQYDVEQIEGRSYHAIRHTEYDQESGVIRYRKNKQQVTEFQVGGEVHNEFSSFFFTRMLALKHNKPVIVPTFADKKRHEVVVQTGEAIRITNEVVGDIKVLPVNPIMDFKGLYDKAGDTVIFLTDDTCRIPVRIISKLLIGSLTAELVAYSSSTCLNNEQSRTEIQSSILPGKKLELGD